MPTLRQELTTRQNESKFLSATSRPPITGLHASNRVPRMNCRKRIIDNPIDEALKIFVPAWPLQNTVAVSPFWNLRHRPFWAALPELHPILHQSLLMPMDYFRQKYATGEISNSDLSEALEQARKVWVNLPHSVADLLKLQWGESHFDRKILTVAEITPSVLDLNDLVISEIGKFASAYFDQNQALIAFPWKSLPFWKAWLKAAVIDRSMAMVGLSGVRDHLDVFEALSPEEAIYNALAGMNVRSKPGQYLYLQRAAATVIGWGSQFCYEEWQRNLGYDTATGARPAELLAVRVVYDYLIYLKHVAENEPVYTQWADTFNLADIGDSTQEEIFALAYVWQLALELSYQRSVSRRLFLKNERPGVARFQLVFCIDVRSEMIRRHIESLNKDCRTIGFAGFFGLGLDYKRCDEKIVGHRLPVLLKPAIALEEVPKDHSLGEVPPKATTETVVASYFRNLRKAPLASFLFVELFGVLSIANLLRRTLRSVYRRVRHERETERFDSKYTKPNVQAATNCVENRCLTTEEKTAFAANALVHMGLKESFGRITLVVGHGAETVNNAFGSALDCGACGGHAGDVNARFLVALLNDQDVRVGLVARNIYVPEHSRFVAAVHETVTDELHILDEEELPQEFKADLAELKSTLERASTLCRMERQTARSHYLDSSAAKRSANWSEVRPEWGLSGNACFIVAPRHRTKGVNLSSRAFLHDYNWKNDEGFKTLELIMTAPMVVTNWINMQYYGSVAAPRYYGSGNKVLHNLTNETGVVEGNGGDLRVGLPIQSVHDGEKYVHDPLRLTVFIEAPRIEIEKIISKHQVVHDLVANEWLHIVQIDSESQLILRRFGDGSYQDISLTGEEA